MMMVGPDGVGKTTLLATMYRELTRIKDQSEFEFAATEDTHHDLQDAYQKLEKIIEQPSFTPTGSLLKGTAGIHERRFEVFFRGKKEFDLVFCDIAGGIIRAGEQSHDFEEFTAKLSKSVVIVNVIDGSALVEGDDSLSTEKNEPEHVFQLLKPTLTDGKNHLMLFVITKCEAWLKTAGKRQALKEAFEERYASMLDLIQHNSNLAGVLIPVKTLGCVEFTRIDYHDDEKDVIFVRKPNLKFRPEGTDQPLRYALAFALNHHEKKRGSWSRFVRWFWGEDIAFRQSLMEFAGAHDKDFNIYGNTSLIEANKQ